MGCRQGKKYLILVLKIDVTTGANFTKTISKTMSYHNLTMNKCREQVYDHSAKIKLRRTENNY